MKDSFILVILKIIWPLKEKEKNIGHQGTVVEQSF
jgi:hypothetical protein